MSEQQGVTSQQIYNMLMESQYWPPEQMQAYQRSQLEQLLRHAKANVPFYKTRLDCMFRHDGSIDWERWEEIPIVTREDLRDRREEMQARVLPTGHGNQSSFFSSGSSGIPIQYTTNSLALLVREAALRRMHTLYGLHAPYRALQYELGGRHTEWPGALLEEPEPPTGPYIDLSWPEETKLSLLRHYRIDVFYGFATSVLLAARVNRTLKKPLSFRLVGTHGMGITESERHLIEDSFSCKSFGIYSSKECGLIAFTCPHSRNYHNCPEAVLMELPSYAEGSRSFTPLLTPLFNTAQPLIRYDQGDVLEHADSKVLGNGCGCHNELPLFRTIQGRRDSYFVFDGKYVPVLGIDDSIFVELLRANAVQIAQTGPRDIEIRYVGTHRADLNLTEHLRTHLSRLFHLNLNVELRHMTDLPRTPNGKQHRFVREYAP